MRLQLTAVIRITSLLVGAALLLGGTPREPIRAGLRLAACGRSVSATPASRAVPPLALTHDLHDRYGWREQAEAVAAAYDALDPAQRATATIVAGNYGEASAINFFGPALGLPRAVSGHMTYHLWGPDPGRSAPILALGLEPGQLDPLCRDPVEVARSDHRLAVPFERHLPVFLCATPRTSLSAAWSRLRSDTHGHARELRGGGGAGP